MIFKDAIEKLEEGYKIKRYAWKNKMYLSNTLNSDNKIELKSFQVEYLAFSTFLIRDKYEAVTEMFTSEKNWKVLGDYEYISFSEAIEALKLRKKVKYKTWKIQYLELDKNRKDIFMFNIYESYYQINDEDILANDWIVHEGDLNE